MANHPRQYLDAWNGDVVTIGLAVPVSWKYCSPEFEGQAMERSLP